MSTAVVSVALLLVVVVVWCHDSSVANLVNAISNSISTPFRGGRCFQREDRPSGRWYERETRRGWVFGGRAYRSGRAPVSGGQSDTGEVRRAHIHHRTNWGAGRSPPSRRPGRVRPPPHKRRGDQPTDRPTNRPSDRPPTDRSTDRPTDRHTDRVTLRWINKTGN